MLPKHARYQASLHPVARPAVLNGADLLYNIFTVTLATDFLRPIRMVGLGPTASHSPSEYSTKLSYTLLCPRSQQVGGYSGLRF